jgi:hypothetical protein
MKYRWSFLFNWLLLNEACFCLTENIWKIKAPNWLNRFVFFVFRKLSNIRNGKMLHAVQESSLLHLILLACLIPKEVIHWPKMTQRVSAIFFYNMTKCSEMHDIYLKILPSWCAHSVLSITYWPELSHKHTSSYNMHVLEEDCKSGEFVAQLPMMHFSHTIGY